MNRRGASHSGAEGAQGSWRESGMDLAEAIIAQELALSHRP